jgi:hypothetical protein
LSEKDFQNEKSKLRMAIVGLVGVVVVVVSISIWNLVLSSKLAKVEDNIESSNKEMQGLVKASAQQIYLKSRLNLVTGFLADRSVARESLQKVLTVNLPGTHISSLSFVDESTLGVTYVASSSADLAELVKYYESDTGYYTQVVSKGLSRSDDKNYQLGLSLTLPVKGQK